MLPRELPTVSGRREPFIPSASWEESRNFARLADDALVVANEAYERAMVPALEEGRRNSLASYASLRALIAAAYLDAVWPEPLAIACFQKGAQVPLYLTDLMTLVFPVEAMPPSPVTLIAEQLKTDRGRLLFTAVHETADAALKASRELAARLRRWLLSPVAEGNKW